MNILFITIENYSNFDHKSIYMDLVNEFINRGHYVSVISACENRDNSKCSSNFYICPGKGDIQKVHIPNITKVSNFVIKGVNLLISIPLFEKAAKKAIKKRKYDLVLYGSPPISIYRAVQIVKKKQETLTYLMLKDIWPYDCLFGGALCKTGWKKIAFEFLAYLARKLYGVSDVIGCMSPANIQFLIDNEPYLRQRNVEICPNSITPNYISLDKESKARLRSSHGIPNNKVVFIYGGSLGIPQGIDFALEAVKSANEIEEAFFVFVGGGTERVKIERFIRDNSLNNLCLLPPLPKDEYEMIVAACDVGLVFLHHECMAPNYPSRILSYMQAKLPILCATDTYTDVGKIAEKNGYGLGCESNNVVEFVSRVKYLCNDTKRTEMGTNAYKYLINNCTSEVVYNTIAKHIL